MKIKRFLCGLAACHDEERPDRNSVCRTETPFVANVPREMTPGEARFMLKFSAVLNLWLQKLGTAAIFIIASCLTSHLGNQ